MKNLLSIVLLITLVHTQCLASSKNTAECSKELVDKGYFDDLVPFGRVHKAEHFCNKVPAKNRMNCVTNLVATDAFQKMYSFQAFDIAIMQCRDRTGLPQASYWADINLRVYKKDYKSLCPELVNDMENDRPAKRTSEEEKTAEHSLDQCLELNNTESFKEMAICIIDWKLDYGMYPLNKYEKTCSPLIKEVVRASIQGAWSDRGPKFIEDVSVRLR